MVKFDIRYMLMLRSLQPLRLYAYNVFWLRFSNKYKHSWGRVGRGVLWSLNLIFASSN